MRNGSALRALLRANNRRKGKIRENTLCEPKYSYSSRFKRRRTLGSEKEGGSRPKYVFNEDGTRRAGKKVERYEAIGVKNSNGRRQNRIEKTGARRGGCPSGGKR